MIPVGGARVLRRCVSYGGAPSEGFLNWTVTNFGAHATMGPQLLGPQHPQVIFARDYVRQYSWSVRRTNAICSRARAIFRGGERDGNHWPFRERASFGRPAGIPLMHSDLPMEAAKYWKTSFPGSCFCVKRENKKKKTFCQGKGLKHARRQKLHVEKPLLLCHLPRSVLDVR